MLFGFKKVREKKVALCIDDIPNSTFDYFGNIKVPLTLFVSGGLNGKISYKKEMFNITDLLDFRDNRQSLEIGCHTYSHNDINTCSNAEFLKDCSKNRDFLKEYMDINETGFSFPRGRWSFILLLRLAKNYQYLRTTRNFILNRICFRYFLPGIPLYSSSVKQLCEKIALNHSVNNAWLIIYTHDICENPSQFGATPEEFMKVIFSLRESGFEFVTLNEMLR